MFRFQDKEEGYLYLYENEQEKFWKNSYLVFLSEFSTPLLINADCASDALDYAIDYAEESGWDGLFFTEEEMEKEDFLDEFMTGGNHGKTLNSLNVRIVAIKDPTLPIALTENLVN